MIVEKIPEFTSFKQSEWLEKYISFNTKKRKRAKNELEKELYKLLIHAFVGKMLENLRNRFKIYFFQKKCLKQNYRTTIKIKIQWYS